MTSRRFLLSALALATCGSALASAEDPTDKLTRESTLIVIATPTAVRFVKDKEVIAGAKALDPKDPRVYRVLTETTFSVSSVVKGDLAVRSLQLTHYSYDSASPIMVAPQLINFTAGSGTRYLMFLRSNDGIHYVVAGDEMNPANFIFQLRNE